MEICLKDVVDIRVPRRDDDNRFMGSLIIELKFEKDIIVRGKSKRISKERGKSERYKKRNYPINK